MKWPEVNRVRRGLAGWGRNTSYLLINQQSRFKVHQPAKQFWVYENNSDLRSKPWQAAEQKHCSCTDRHQIGKGEEKRPVLQVLQRHYENSLAFPLQSPPVSHPVSIYLTHWSFSLCLSSFKSVIRPEKAKSKTKMLCWLLRKTCFQY